MGSEDYTNGFAYIMEYNERRTTTSIRPRLIGEIDDPRWIPTVSTSLLSSIQTQDTNEKRSRFKKMDVVVVVLILK